MRFDSGQIPEITQSEKKMFLQADYYITAEEYKGKCRTAVKVNKNSRQSL
jgi:hypothetical protein